MLILSSTSDKIQLVTSSDAALSVHASFAESDISSVLPDRQNTNISAAATTDIVSPPGADAQRQIKTIIVRNTDPDDLNTIIVQHTDGTTVSQLFKCTLRVGECLQFIDGDGFTVYGPSGAKKFFFALIPGSNAMPDIVEPYNVGDVSDELRDWTEQVALLLSYLNTQDSLSLYGFSNLRFNCVKDGSNNLVFSILTEDGSTPSPQNPVKVAFRSLTITSGEVDVVEITSATTLTIPSAAPLAVGDSALCTLLAVLCRNSTGVQLGVVQNPAYGTSASVTSSTTAISGSANDGNIMYTTSALSAPNVFIQVGSVIVQRGTGAWSNNPTHVKTERLDFNIRNGVLEPFSVAQRNAAGEVLTAAMHGFAFTAAAAAGNPFVAALRSRVSNAAPTTRSPVTLPFRSNTATSPTVQYVSYNATTELSFPADATLGFASGSEGYAYLYAVTDGTNKEIGICSTWKDLGKLYSTTAIGTGSDLADTIYTPTAMSNAALFPLGRVALRYVTGDWSQAVTFTTFTREPYRPDSFWGAEIASAATKATPANSDLFGFLDSAAQFVLKKFTWSDLLAAISTALSGTFVLLSELAERVGDIVGVLFQSDPNTTFTYTDGSDAMALTIHNVMPYTRPANSGTVLAVPNNHSLFQVGELNLTAVDELQFLGTNAEVLIL